MIGKIPIHTLLGEYMQESVAKQKTSLRQNCKQLRLGISQSVRFESSLAICNLISSWQVFQFAEVILTYLPIKSEVNLYSLMEAHPEKKWCLPRIIEADKNMIFHPYDSQQLVHHRFGMDEPSPDLPAITPETIQLVLVPGLAYDLKGNRLGYGGGYYDRFLASYSGISLGITFETLLLEELPTGEYDSPVNYVVTQNKLIRPLK